VIATEDGQLSWAPYALDGRELENYFETDRYYAAFPSGSVVLDVGCGGGFQLQQLLDRGCRGMGTEVDDRALAHAREKGRPVVRAPAEALPLDRASVDGIVFRGVLPFTDEHRAFAEIARVLRPGGRMEALYLGPGYALRDLLLGRSLGARYYGARALVNSLLMVLAGRKLPGKFGDVAYITPGRLERHYARHGLALRHHAPSPTFLGLPVFIYHGVERVGSSTHAGGTLPPP
jgi:SAM-dependent methyltransferase